MDINAKPSIGNTFAATLEQHPQRFGGILYCRENNKVIRYLSPDGKSTDTFLQAGAPIVVLDTEILEMNLEDAKALQKELHELLQKYRSKRGLGRYLMRLGLTPC